MTATIHPMPVRTAQADPAPLETDGGSILFASLLLRSGATSAMAREDAARWPVFLPVAETMERLEASRDLIREASGR